MLTATPFENASQVLPQSWWFKAKDSFSKVQNTTVISYASKKLNESKRLLKLHIIDSETVPSSLLTAVERDSEMHHLPLLSHVFVSMQRKPRHVALTGVTAHPNRRWWLSLNYICDQACGTAVASSHQK